MFPLTIKGAPGLNLHYPSKIEILIRLIVLITVHLLLNASSVDHDRRDCAMTCLGCNARMLVCVIHSMAPSSSETASPDRFESPDTVHPIPDDTRHQLSLKFEGLFI